MSAYASIDDLRSQLGRGPKAPSDQTYAERMMHKIPDAEVVNREDFILEHCKGKRVLEFGASGLLHEAIMKVAAVVYSSDKNAEGVNESLDLDDVTKPFVTHESAENVRPDVIVCGEVIEHLSNPGWFLTRLRKQYAGIPTIITVPNAFSEVARKHILTGVENVNADHVFWPSFRTMKTLLGRAGYTDFSFAWYRGQPLTAEGLVILCEG